MTVQDFIDIARNEDVDPWQLEVVINIGGTTFDLHTSDDQPRPGDDDNAIRMTITQRCRQT